MIQNKAPGKDVSAEDMKEKFPLASKNNNEHFSKFEVSGVTFGEKLIPVMAGPNMVESEKLIVETAINVKNAGAHFLRGGAFKLERSPSQKMSACVFNVNCCFNNEFFTFNHVGSSHNRN